MNKWLRNYFDFSRREFNGVMTLIVLIGLTMLFPYIYGLIKKEEPITAADQLAVLKLVLAEQEKKALKDMDKLPFKYSEKGIRTLFTFDPNTIDQMGWEQLGLSAKQALAILKYREKGGQFKKVQDLQKMYTINEAMYNRLRPYVRITGDQSAVVEGERVLYKEQAYDSSFGRAFEEGPETGYKKSAYEKGKVFVIEINGADTTELDKIRGIGMTFANRIIKYRDRIGGFYKKEQLMEVFGLDSVKYNEIKDQVEIDVSHLKKINVNTAVFEDFKNHPYIRYKQVNALIQYRKQHGNYGNIADLNKVVIMDQETIGRLAAYLEF